MRERDAPFVLYAWRGEPDESTSSPQPYRMGTMCFATFLSVGLPKPLKVWNNAGRRGQLGQPDYPSQPAPSTVVARPTGWHQAITVTFQGLIADSGTAADVPASVTNAVVLRVQDC